MKPKMNEMFVQTDRAQNKTAVTQTAQTELNDEECQTETVATFSKEI